jgi:hypothetical protein
VSDWFFMLGEPPAESERALVRGYLSGLCLDGQTAIASVATFVEAARIISHPDWDRRWWDAEQRERERLRAKAASGRDDTQLLQALSQSAEQAIVAPHGAAAVQAARVGCSDPGLIRAAAGALGEALYLAKLAELASEPPSHPFSSKLALFTGGHWPLGLVEGKFYLF